MAHIRLEHVTKVFGSGPRAAISDLSLEVNRGELMVLLGPSGCGKTTTLKLIAGFEEPDRGRIHLAGRVVAGHRAFVPPEKRGVGMVFQDYALFPHLRVAANIMFGLRGMPAAAKRKRLDTVLELVGLTGEAHKYPHQISGGQQQRVALARALAPNPSVILMDEPLSNLDADLRARMRGELHNIIHAAGATAIMVTHDQDDAFAMADRMAILDQGSLEQVGTPEEIYHQPLTRFVADFVGQADFLPGEVQVGGAVTELGFITAETSLPAGEPVEVMIRPDDISLRPDPAGNALVIERHFRGADHVYELKLPSGRILHSIQSSNVHLEVGRSVAASADPSHVVLFSLRTGEVEASRRKPAARARRRPNAAAGN